MALADSGQHSAYPLIYFFLLSGLSFVDYVICSLVLRWLT